MNAHSLNGEQLEHFLRMMHADRDPDGRTIVSGSVHRLMGIGNDYIVGDDVRYFVNGEPRGLAIGLAGTSYGRRTTLI